MDREITDQPTIETVYKELLALGDRVEQIYRILERWTDKNHLDSVVNYYKNQLPPGELERLIAKNIYGKMLPKSDTHKHQR